MDERAKAFIKLLKMDESGELTFRSYSGRGMYNATCLGITGSLSSIFSNLMALALEAGENLTGDEKDAIIMGLSRGTATDSMGLGAIVYFPGIKFTRQDEIEAGGNADDEEEDEDCTDDD